MEKQNGFLQYTKLAKQEFQKLCEKHPELVKLSARELEVFMQLLTDKTQEQIASELYVTSSAVHFHCKNIYNKLSVSGRRQILVKYKDI